ncbi:MAG: hypothetical protein HOP08_00735 [Cyclobacteriaceae bacterium]|nr:hypothetical protein [Cyclobacteriaceae bacterium]
MKTTDVVTAAASLEQSMKEQLEILRQDEQDVIVRLSKIILMVGKIIYELRRAVVAHGFENVTDEIYFFKEIKPLFLAQFHFHKRLLVLHSNEPTITKDRLSFYLEELERMKEQVNAHDHFSQYCMTGSTGYDEKYFVRGNLEFSDIISDREFSTGYDEVLSQLLTIRLLRDHIMGLIAKLSPDERSITSSLTWTASKADLIELIYGLETIGVLNKGKADIKEIAVLFENVFNISLGNYYRQFLDIRLRKKGKTTFLDEMKEKLEIRINDFN